MRFANPLGAFVARDTPLARIDARVKIALLLAVAVAVFATGISWAFLAWIVVLVLVCRTARLDITSHVRSLLPVAFILAFTLAANALALDGHGDIALVGPVGIDTAGGLRGVVAVARIVVLLGLALSVSASTTPPQLADACVSLLSPLARFRVPVADIGLMLSLALRFIPIVSEEFSRIQLAQRSRGVDFERGGIVARVSSWASVLTPLVVSLFRRAERLGESMEARCYAGGDGTCITLPPLARRDRAVLVVGVLVAAAIPLAAWLV